MTREEVSTELGRMEFTTGQILGISGRILFENMGMWLLFSLVVFLPTGALLQALSLQIPTKELLKMLQEGNLDILSRQDLLKPILVMNGAQVLLMFVHVLTNIAACLFTDKWLQKSAALPTIGILAEDTLKKWPRALLITLIYILGVAGYLLFTVLTASFGLVFLLLFALILLAAYWSFLYYYSVSATSIRPYVGMAAFKFASSMIRRRKSLAIGLILTCILINALFSALLQLLTTSFTVLIVHPVLLCVASGLVSVVANLPNFLISIAATIYLVNQEQFSLQITAGMNPVPETEDIDPFIDPDDFSKKA